MEIRLFTTTYQFLFLILSFNMGLDKRIIDLLLYLYLVPLFSQNFGRFSFLSKLSAELTSIEPNARYLYFGPIFLPVPHLS